MMPIMYYGHLLSQSACGTPKSTSSSLCMYTTPHAMPSICIICLASSDACFKARVHARTVEQGTDYGTKLRVQRYRGMHKSVTGTRGMVVFSRKQY